MIIDNAVLEAETSGKKIACKIEANSVMFELLSARLYKNKPLAVIRELSTNGFDAQIENGNADKPMKVHLPTLLEPYYEIRDYGVGMTKEVVEELYSTMGSSSKRHSNLFNGALGVGSKAPFAYTQGGAFTLTSFVDGVKYIYSIFSDAGVPSITELGNFETDEPNGVSVSVPVQVEDISSFQREAKNVYEWFPTKPILNVELKYSTDEKPLIEGTFTDGTVWKVLPFLDNANVVMANVAYPISSRPIGYDSIMLTNGLVIYANTGDVQMAGSREDLSYTKETISKLKEWEKELQAQIVEKVNEALKSGANFLELCRILSELPQAIYQVYRNTEAPKFLKYTYSRPVICSGDTFLMRKPRRYNTKTEKRSQIGFDEFSKITKVFIEDNKTKANDVVRTLVAQRDLEFITLTNQVGAHNKEEFIKEATEFCNKLGIKPILVTDYVKSLGSNVKTLSSNSSGSSSYVSGQTKFFSGYKYDSTNQKMSSISTQFSNLTDGKVIIVPTTNGKVVTEAKKYYSGSGVVKEIAYLLQNIKYTKTVYIMEVPSSYKKVGAPFPTYDIFLKQILRRRKFVSYVDSCYKLDDEYDISSEVYRYKEMLPKELQKVLTFIEVEKSNRVEKSITLINSMFNLNISVSKKNMPKDYISILKKYDVILGFYLYSDKQKERCKKVINLLNKNNNNKNQGV